MMHIGQEIRRRREEQGLTGLQLAVKAGMTPSAVSQIETGKRTPNSASVIKLAAALGVEVGELYPKVQSPLPFDEQVVREEFGLPPGVVGSYKKRSIVDAVLDYVLRLLETAEVVAEIRAEQRRQAEKKSGEESYEDAAARRLLLYPREEVVETVSRLRTGVDKLEEELERAAGAGPSEHASKTRSGSA